MGTIPHGQGYDHRQKFGATESYHFVFGGDAY